MFDDDDEYRYDPSDRCPKGAFEYPELDPTIPSTRIIRLLKAGRPDSKFTMGRIRCEMDVAYIGSNRIAFDAVSYTWETNEMDRVIELSGKAFKVSRVVESILLKLRREKEDRLLWVDQICINQNDQDEKASQVGRISLEVLDP